jgi:hypothetical protein
MKGITLAGASTALRRHAEYDRIPIGAIVRTPRGMEAVVIGYRGFRRDYRIRLVCKYVDPENRAFDVVQLVPELVTVLEVPDGA